MTKRHRRGAVAVPAALGMITISFLLWSSSSSFSTDHIRAFGVVAASSSSSSSSAPPPLTGLKNLGNTCYMNAQLQCAFHIPLVRNIVLEQQKAQNADNKVESSSSSSSSSSQKQSKASSSKKSSSSTSSPGLLALRTVFDEMMTRAMVASPYSGPIVVSPIVLTQTLGIPVMEQQDSQEFWKLLLPALQAPQLVDLYQGAFEDYIVAQDGSGRGRSRQEVFLDLSLDVGSTSSSSSSQSVTDCLAAAFGEAEMLKVSEGNGWRPEKGADKVNALKGSRLHAQGLPCILQLHLKRFTYDWNRGVMEKNNAPVRFSDELDLSSLVCNEDGTDNANDATTTMDNKDNLIYDLQGVVIHVGQFNVGHYYAYVRPDVRENRWWRINDDEIDEVSFEEVLTDAIGGKVQLSSLAADVAKKQQSANKKRGLFGKILGLFGNGSRDGASYGFGGSTSNAYVLQYVKRSERDRLYKS